MANIIETLKEIFKNGAALAFPSLQSFTIELTESKQDAFGHYQCNSAMKLAKQLQIPPRKVAEAIVKEIDKRDVIALLEIAGPGFINITLAPLFLQERVQKMAEDPRLGVPYPLHRERLIVEFSSPNIAKQLHVGHLRSTIIGESLARLFEYLGQDVLRLNHIGDWGTAFGMLIAYLKEEKPEILTGKEDTDLDHLVEWYKASKKRFDEDAAFKKRSQLEVVALQGGDTASLKAWQHICHISRVAFQEIYHLLDVTNQERGESFYNPMLPTVVKDLEQKKLIQISDGAKCVFMEGFKGREGEPLPMIIQKSDGGYNYATTDLAALKHRVEVEKADRIIIVTDLGQSLHFQMLFQASLLAGYYDPQKVRMDHVTFGLVLGPDGKKFKTRSGETESLLELLKTAISQAEKILEGRKPEMEREERRALAEAIGIASVKYADLSCNRTGDYTFSYDRMLRFEGNTAAFLLYSYVRIASIERKMHRGSKLLPSQAKIELSHPSEFTLALHLLRFPELLQQMASDLLPNHLTEYLYELSCKFNAFYRDCTVEGSEYEESRLLLAQTVARTLKQGLFLLGIRTVDRM